MIVDDHMTAYLSWVKVIVPDLQQTDYLVGDDVEDEDVEGMVARIDQEPFESILSLINPTADVEGHQEAEESWDGK